MQCNGYRRVNFNISEENVVSSRVSAGDGRLLCPTQSPGGYCGVTGRPGLPGPSLPQAPRQEDRESRPGRTFPAVLLPPDQRGAGALLLEQEWRSRHVRPGGQTAGPQETADPGGQRGQSGHKVSSSQTLSTNDFKFKF